MADLDIDALTVEYASGGYAVRPIDGLSLKASSGELVVVLGPSGSGKTTLLSCLAGILSPTSGRISVAGADVTRLDASALATYRRSTVGIVFQAFNLIPSLTALENVEAPLWMAGVKRHSARAKATALLEHVGLGDRMRHRPGELSGGQQQRVAIARALVHDPPLVIADEPTAHLDYIQVESVLTLVREIAKPGRLVVVATHDERLVPLADRVLDLSPKAHLEARAPEEVTLEKGEYLFRQGDRGSLIYVVEKGEIEILRTRADHSEELITVIKAGEHFGELAPLLGMPRTASARAPQNDDDRIQRRRFSPADRPRAEGGSRAAKGDETSGESPGPALAAYCMTMHRTQLYLDDEQYRWLKQQAGRKGSIASVVRELIDRARKKPSNYAKDPLTRYLLEEAPSEAERTSNVTTLDEDLYGR